MSQTAIEWLEDEVIQERIAIFRDTIYDFATSDGYIYVFDSPEQFLVWVKNQYKIEPTEEEIEFVDLKSYFP